MQNLIMKKQQSNGGQKAESMLRILYPFNSTLWAVILVAVVYVLSICLLPKQGFWNVDNANKFLQVKAIMNSNYSDYSIPWPGKTIDPDFSYNPLPYPFSKAKDHKLFSLFSPVFATISSLFFKPFGFWGLYILPAVSSVLMLIGLGKMAKTMGLKDTDRYPVFLIAGLCTPIWFYSVVFWEHIVAVCLCVWGIYFYLKFLEKKSAKNLVLGSALSAFSIYFRDELYLFCIAIIGVTLICTSGKRLKTAFLAILTMIVSIVPLWLFQWITIGQPFGFHLGGHLFFTSGITEHILLRTKVLYNLFMASNPNVWTSLVIGAPFIVTFLLNPRFSGRIFNLAVPLYSLMASAGFFFVLKDYFGPAGPINWMLQTNSLFAASPVLILAFLRLKETEDSFINPALVKWIWLVGLVYAFLYGLAAPELGSTGIHWGNRFLLVLYPLFALLAAVNLVQWFRCFKQKVTWRTVILVLTVLISFAAQTFSIHILHKKKDFSYRLNHAIQKRPEQIVVSDLWWVPQELFSEFYDKSMFYVRSQKHANQLLEKILKNGHTKLIFITQTSSEPPESPVVTVNDNSLNFFSLEFFTVELYDPTGVDSSEAE